MAHVLAVQKVLHVRDAVAPHGLPQRPRPRHRDDARYASRRARAPTGDVRDVQVLLLLPRARAVEDAQLLILLKICI